MVARIVRSGLESVQHIQLDDEYDSLHMWGFILCAPREYRGLP